MKSRVFENFFLVGQSLTGGAVVATVMASLLGITPVPNAIGVLGAALGCALAIGASRKALAQSAEPAE
jgi:hypothetical protein